MTGGAKLVQDLYAAFARRDIAAVLGALADDVDWSVPKALPHGGLFKGRERVGEFFKGIGERWTTIALRVDDVVDGGEHVVGIGRATGELTGVGPASYGFAHVMTISNGRVVRFREFVDPDDRLRAHQ